MTWEPNDGRRPSRYAMGQRIVGEQPADDAPHGDAFAREIERAREELPPFDWAALQADVARARARRAPPRWRRAWAPAAAAAAAALLLVAPSERGGNNLKGNADLGFYVLQGDEVRSGVPGERLRAGDQVQFTYRTEWQDDLVLVGVDARGAVNVYYPRAGQSPEPIEPGGLRVLEGSLVLDDALGDEYFVAIFDAGSVREARARVVDAWRGGPGALAALAREDASADLVRIRKVR